MPDLLEDVTFPAVSFRVEVDAAGAGARLDRFLAAQAMFAAAGLSRTRLQSLIAGGQVRIDDVAATGANVAVRAGQQISVEVPSARDPLPQGESIPLRIVYEDASLLVIDKPSGLVVHPAAGHETGTLVNALIAHCGTSLSGIGGVRRPGIVHRLDKDTSGLLVVAKTDVAHQGLAALFADHGRNLPLTREYRAFVWGHPSRAVGTVEAPIGRHPQDRERMAPVAPGKGRAAVTHWRCVESYVSASGVPTASLMACRLETGRTHQIRVHMTHIGHPLLGDEVYARGFRSKVSLLDGPARTALEQLGRQALHAAVLGFAHPVTGEIMHFESPLPDDLEHLRAALSAMAG